MTLFNVMMLFNTDCGDEFGADAPPPLGGPAFHVDPLYLLGGAVLIGIVVGVIAAVMYLAQRQAERRVRSDCEGSAKAIYDSVKWYLDEALRAPGSSILDRGREVADVLEARLGAVLALDSRAGKPFGELAKALKGDKPAAGVGAPKVKVARATDDHAFQVWNALQDLNTFWSDQPRVMRLLVAAQRELVTAPKPLPIAMPMRPGPGPRGAAIVKVEDKPKVKSHQSLWDEIPDTRRDNPKKVKVVRETKPKAETRTADEAKPIVMPKPVVETDGPPEPPPPPPPAPLPGGAKRKKDLPVHKRNMLA